MLSTYTGQRLPLGFRSRLFEHAERLSFSYHDSRGSADSSSRIQSDAPAINTVAVSGAIAFFTSVTTLAGMIYVTARIDWQLALIALGVTPPLLLALLTYRGRLRRHWHDAKKLESSALSIVQEALEDLRVVKAFGREEHERERFARRSRESMHTQLRLTLAEGAYGILVGMIIGVGMGTVVFIGARRVQAGSMTLGDLVLVMAYLQQLYDPLKTAAKKASDLQGSLASIERVYALFDEPPDFVDKPTARPLSRARAAVAFREVSFEYENGHHVLQDISFEVPPGTRLGIAGSTGAGKTSLVSLLTRFCDPTNGEILLDGTDLRDYKLADLRNQLTIVLQEPILFSATITDNIAYARPDADRLAIVAAAQAAHAHSFIMDLLKGYETQVGERGMRLSGGERQRITLAPAFLKDAPILILDEPTSSVDVRTEAVIMEAMERLMSGRTTFMVAHRLGTLAGCDMRLDLEDGRFVDLSAGVREPHPRTALRGRA